MLLDVVERGTVDVVVVGAVVEVVVVGAVVVVFGRLAGSAAADVVEVVDDVDEAGLGLVVRLGRLTTSGTVVEVVDVEVKVVVVPSGALDGVSDGSVPSRELVVVVAGTDPVGASGVVVLVVGELVVVPGSPVWTGGVVVVDVEVLGDAPVVEVVEVAEEVTEPVVVGAGVVVEVVAAGDVGTVVVVLEVVVVAPVLVVVVAAVVVVTDDDDGGSNGVDIGVVSASAGTFGATSVPSARPMAKSAPPDVAASRASHLLELCEDKLTRVPTLVSPIGSPSSPPPDGSAVSLDAAILGRLTRSNGGQKNSREPCWLPAVWLIAAPGQPACIPTPAASIREAGPNSETALLAGRPN